MLFIEDQMYANRISPLTQYEGIFDYYTPSADHKIPYNDRFGNALKNSVYEGLMRARCVRLYDEARGSR